MNTSFVVRTELLMRYLLVSGFELSWVYFNVAQWKFKGGGLHTCNGLAVLCELMQIQSPVPAERAQQSPRSGLTWALCLCGVLVAQREKGRGQTGASAQPLTEVSFSLHVEVRALWLELLIILEGNLESNFHCPSLPGAGFLLALSTCPGFSDCPTFQPNWAAPHQISKSGLASSDAIFHFITQ